MKALKTGLKLVLAVFFIVGLVGCANDPEKLACEYVKSSNGEIYEVIPRTGDLYWLKKVDKAKNGKLNKIDSQLTDKN